MLPIQVHHDGSEVYLEERARSVRLFLKADPRVKRAFVRTIPDGEEYITHMEPVAEGWWSAEVGLEGDVLTYRFVLKTDEGNWYYTGMGLSRHIPTDHHDFRFLRRAQLPGWIEGAVFYQVFPDRFRRGPDDSIRVKPGELTIHGLPSVVKAWHEEPERDLVEREFFGGDLWGVREALDTIQSMGFNSLYLNPIWKANTNHRYDVVDYGAVDPHLGGEKALQALTDELHERGMRLVLDFVPNHCSWDHPWFVEARSNPEARTREYFIWDDYPEKYATWLDFLHLPKLNYRSDRLRREMAAYLRKWLLDPYRIDGYRLDVVNMLGKRGDVDLSHEFVRQIRQIVKAENPQAYLVGEHFLDATAYLQGHQLDACMNYRGFGMPVLHWLSGQDMATMHGYEFGDTVPITAVDMAHQWRAFLAAIPWQIACSQLNLLTSHDVPRLRTLLRADDRLIQVALTLLYTFPGTPSLYYGEEVGMLGGRDPANRGPMIWDPSRWHEPTRQLVRRLASLRRDLSALRRGGFEVLHMEFDRVVYRRLASDQSVIVDAARAACNGLPLAVGRLSDLFSGQSAGEGGLPGHSAPGARLYLEEPGELQLYPFTLKGEPHHAHP